MLRRQGVDVNPAQEMMCRASPRIILAIYKQNVSEKKLFERSFAIGTLRDPRGGQEGKNSAINQRILLFMAGTTGLEPATSAVTGQRSNQLSYVPSLFRNNWDEVL